MTVTKTYDPEAVARQTGEFRQKFPWVTIAEDDLVDYFVVLEDEHRRLDYAAGHAAVTLDGWTPLIRRSPPLRGRGRHRLYLSPQEAAAADPAIGAAANRVFRVMADLVLARALAEQAEAAAA